MARSPVRRFFGTLSMLLILLVFAAFVFIVYAYAVGDPTVKEWLQKRELDEVAVVATIVMGIFVVVILFLVLIRSRREKQQDDLFQPAVDQDELARQRQAQLESAVEQLPDIAGGPDVVVYNVGAVPGEQKAWDQVIRKKKKDPGVYPYAFPRHVDRGVYTNTYIPIGKDGSQLKLRILIAGPKGKEMEALPPGKALKPLKMKKKPAAPPAAAPPLPEAAAAATTSPAEAASAALPSGTAAPPAGASGGSAVDEMPGGRERDQVLLLRERAGPQGGGRDFIAELDEELRRRGTGAATAASRPEAFYGYPGDNHDVGEVEGIGTTHARKLKGLGVETTARLCYEDAARLARELGVPKKTVEQWQASAELIKVTGIGPQFADALAASGVMGIADLKRRSAANIAKDVQEYLEKNKVSGAQKVTERRVEGWQEAAADMRKVRQKVPER